MYLLLLAIIVWLLGACATLAWAIIILVDGNRKAMRVIPSAFILGPLIFLLLSRDLKEPTP